MDNNKNKTLAEQAEERFGKKNEPGLKEKLNNWLDENVNQPLNKKGYSKTGSAISALGSAAGEMYIPESAADLAMSVFPAGKAIKALSKTKKAAKAADEVADATKESAAFYGNLKVPTAAPKPPTASEWKKMTDAERKAVKELSEEKAPAVKYEVTEPDAIGVSRQNTAKKPKYIK